MHMSSLSLFLEGWRRRREVLMVACNYGVVIAMLSELKSEGTGRTQLGGGGCAIYRQDEWQHNTDGGDEEARRTRWATPICLGLSQADHCGLLVFACNS